MFDISLAWFSLLSHISWMFSPPTFTFRSPTALWHCIASVTNVRGDNRFAWSDNSTLNCSSGARTAWSYTSLLSAVSGSVPTPTSLPLVTQLSPAFWMDQVQREPWRVPLGKTSDKVLVSDLSLFFQHIGTHTESCITCPRIIVELGWEDWWQPLLECSSDVRYCCMVLRP